MGFFVRFSASIEGLAEYLRSLMPSPDRHVVCDPRARARHKPVHSALPRYLPYTTREEL